MLLCREHFSGHVVHHLSNHHSFEVRVFFIDPRTFFIEVVDRIITITAISALVISGVEGRCTSRSMPYIRKGLLKLFIFAKLAVLFGPCCFETYFFNFAAEIQRENLSTLECVNGKCLMTRRVI